MVEVGHIGRTLIVTSVHASQISVQGISASHNFSVVEKKTTATLLRVSYVFSVPDTAGIANDGEEEEAPRRHWCQGLHPCTLPSPFSPNQREICQHPPEGAHDWVEGDREGGEQGHKEGESAGRRVPVRARRLPGDDLHRRRP